MLALRMGPVWSLGSMLCALSGIGQFKDTGILARDVTTAVIPAKPASGKVHGSPFKVERAELTRTEGYAGDKRDKKNTYHLATLTLRQGKEFFADKEFRITIAFDRAKKLDGLVVLLKPVRFSEPVPSVKLPGGVSFPVVQGITASYRPPGETLPKSDMTLDRYSLQLRFGAMKGGQIPGRIYCAMPDKEKSFVAGTFTATLRK
jgi:hypothetical protein